MTFLNPLINKSGAASATHAAPPLTPDSFNNGRCKKTRHIFRIWGIVRAD